MTFNYDVIVVGAGHAGCEAAARQYGFKDASHYNGYEQDCTDELQSGSRRYRQRTDRP